MGSGKNRPTVDAYFGSEAEEYGKSQWMARNQIQTTIRALELLFSDNYITPLIQDDTPLLFLDMGCGTGYSSHTILETGDRVIGLDLSRDMIGQNPYDFDLAKIQADIRNPPLRQNSVDHVISISAFNFITTGAKNDAGVKKLIAKSFENLLRVTNPESRVVIEFYPTPKEERVFMQELKRMEFSGGLMVDDPKTKKEKKFLLLQNTTVNK